MLVKSSKLLKAAAKEKRPVFAFNVLNLEMSRAVIETAEKLHTPVMVQITAGAMNWAKFDYIVPAIISAAKHAQVQIAVHLDHTTDLALIKKAVDAGFSSVMFDGSFFDFNKNVTLSNQAIKIAHAKNVEVEIEIGKVGGKEDGIKSDVADKMEYSIVKKFYEQTKPDFLAVAFGTSHGKYKGDINLDFDLITTCHQSINVPLVMHGTSGVPFADIKKAVACGITKINVGTDLLIANFDHVRKYLMGHPEEYNIRKIHEVGIEAMKARIEQYLTLI